MELKRILARDTRSATEQAIALYGPDVLVISNHQVDGQTELVVALDVQPEPTSAPVVAPAASTFQRSFMQAQQVSTPLAPITPLAPLAPLAPLDTAGAVATVAVKAAEPATEKTDSPSVDAPWVRVSSITPTFISAPLPAADIPAAPAVPVALLHTLAQVSGSLPSQSPAGLDTRPALPAKEPRVATASSTVPQAAAAAPTTAAPVPTPEAASLDFVEMQAQAQAREMQRSRELVDLVRGDIAALRREFRLSQQTSAWQSGLQLHPSLGVLVEALNEAQVPMALRALLIDALQDQNEPHQALAVWRSQLEHSLARPQQAMPSQGLHVLAGPSGSGKTMMCARLAHHASDLRGSERLALISYRDHRAGAWSQIQMLGAQLGIDCFRANDEDALRLLVGELSARGLVLIDTPGVQMTERLAEIKAVAPQAALHAVVSADASGAALRRVLVDAGINWHSVMISKLDEAQSPWALLQLFSDHKISLSCASGASRMTDLICTFTLPQLIDVALAPLQLQIGSATPGSHAVTAPIALAPIAPVAPVAPVAQPPLPQVQAIPALLEILGLAPEAATASVFEGVVKEVVRQQTVVVPAKTLQTRVPRKATAPVADPVRAAPTRPVRSTPKNQAAPIRA